MKMKSIFNKKILIAIATISSLSLQSCLDDDDNYAMRFPNALVTVKTDADQTVFLQLDDKTTLLPTNMTKSPYGEKEVRALVNYKEVDEPSDIYTQAVHINWIDSILTKPIAPDLGEENDTVYGTDPVEIVNDWVTIAEDGYLTLRFRTQQGDYQTKHFVNLLLSENPENPYEVEFRHNAKGDIYGRYADVVLHGGGHIHIHILGPPMLGTGHELAAEVVGIGLAVHGILGTHLQNEVQLLLGVDAVGIVDIAVGAGHISDLGAQLSGLLHDAPCHVAVAGQGDALALDGVALVLEDLLQIVDSAVAGGLRADQGATVAEALAGEDAVLPSALQAAILAEQVADLTAAHAHVAGGDVHVRPNVAVQSRHEALAEAHDLGVGLAGGIKVGAALGTADG